MVKQKTKFRKGSLTAKLHRYQRIGVLVGIIMFELVFVGLNALIKPNMQLTFLPFVIIFSIIFGVMGFLFTQSLVLSEMEYKKRYIKEERYKHHYNVCVDAIKKDDYETVMTFYDNLLRFDNRPQSYMIRAIIIASEKRWDLLPPKY